MSYVMVDIEADGPNPGDNNGFDWQFINWYFHHFTGANRLRQRLGLPVKSNGDRVLTP